jgi:hypothetical protein
MTAASVPVSELYFAVLDRPVSPRGRARAEEIAYALEAALPVPLDSVHAVYRHLPDDRVLAIAIEKTRAESLARTHTSAHPTAWSDWLAPLAEQIEPTSINLLSGPCRSPRVSTAQNALIRHACIGLALIALTASIGLERRIRAQNTDTTSAQARAAEIYTRALGPAPNAAQPHAARMTSELRRLRTTRGPAAATRTQTPADTVLAALLSAWPADSQARTESITIAERTVEVILRVDDLDAAQTFISALATAPGLRPGPAKTDREGNEIRLSLRLDREDAP